MRYAVEDLSGAKLDTAVAAALCWQRRADVWQGRTSLDGRVTRDDMPAQALAHTFCPSLYWQYGGPIIERERIALRPSADEWVADWMGERGTFVGLGPTPLIAAMRAFVASQLGDEVDL